MDSIRRLPPGSVVPLIKVILLIAVWLVLILTWIVPYNEGRVRARESSCISNLAQIGRMAEIYRKNFGGPDYLIPGDDPRVLGAAWHQQIIDFVSDNRDNSCWQCPLEGRDGSFGTDYRGPAMDPNPRWNYKLQDAIAGDKVYPGNQTNHGDAARRGVNALTKGYQVLKITSNDTVRWRQFLYGTKD